MDLIGRYVFRTTLVAFLIITLSLTLILWFTQIIREFDLVTNQRQAVVVFIGVTSLFIPLLVMMISPIALVIATGHVLNKLSSDSEIIVMNAAGVSPWWLLRPFLAAASLVSLLVALIAIYLSPLSLHALRDKLTEIRADLLTNVIQPGRFTTIGGNLTFHIAGRQPDGVLLGIFINDRRDPKETTSYLAETGKVYKNQVGTFLILSNGTIQRLSTGDPRVVTFKDYAFDMSKFTAGPQTVKYSVSEKPLWELASQSIKEPLEQAQYRSEFHDRIAEIFYPIVFVILVYMFLAPPQTTRQSRVLSALAMIGAVTLVRVSGFLCTILGVNIPALLMLPYAILLGTLAICLWQISRGVAIEPAAIVSKLATAISARINKAATAP